MSWELRDTSGPYPAPWEGRDAVGWVWELYGENDESRRILVEVSGTAMAVAPEYLPEETRLARETSGRSEVERVLELDDPPRRVSLGTTGYLGAPPDAPAEPGWSVKLHGRAEDLETLANLFAEAPLHILERAGAYYLRSQQFAGLTDARQVQTRAADLIRQANGAAALELEGFRPVGIGGEVDVVWREPSNGD